MNHRSKPYTTTMENETNISVGVCFCNRITHPRINAANIGKKARQKGYLSFL